MITTPTWTNSNTTWHEIFRKFPNEEQYMQILGPAKDYPILLQAIGKMPVDIIEMIITKIGVDLSLRDEDGKNALMVALTKASEYDMKFWPEYFEPIVKMILNEAKKRQNIDTTQHNNSMLYDETGRHLLHIVADLGLSWDLTKALVQQDPEELSSLDSLTGLWPFMLAAREEVSSSDNNTNEKGGGIKSNLSTCFELLRERPHVLKNVVQEDGTAMLID